MNITSLLNWKTFLVIAFVAIAAAVVYSNYAAQEANEGIVMGQHIKGNPDATVVLTEHSDFQCPACAQFYPIIKEILTDYPELGFEYRHFPLVAIHPFAVPAAKAAEAAAQQDKFFEMHDKLFENQQIWSRSPNPRAFFEQYAEELGLNMDQFRRQYGASIIDDHIQTEYNAARELGLTGTPSFFLNGERLEFETYEDFRAQIEAALNPGGVTTETTAEGADNAASAIQSDVRFGF